MQAQTNANTLMTVTEAANVTPGRPSTNCLWRWCRRGVWSRSGERVRLQHRRIGGKIFTSSDWLDEFGRKLAEADTRHFDQCEQAAADAAAREPRIPRRRKRSRPRRVGQDDMQGVEAAEQELNEAGIR